MINAQVNFLFFFDGSQSSIVAVSELVTTCLMLVSYFKWEYTVPGTVSTMKKYKM